MLSERIRQAAAADDEERDRDGAPAAGEGPGTNGSRVGSCRCSHGAPRRREIYCRIGICRGWPSGDFERQRKFPRQHVFEHWLSPDFR